MTDDIAHQPDIYLQELRFGKLTSVTREIAPLDSEKDGLGLDEPLRKKWGDFLDFVGIELECVELINGKKFLYCVYSKHF